MWFFYLKSGARLRVGVFLCQSQPSVEQVWEGRWEDNTLCLSAIPFALEGEGNSRKAEGKTGDRRKKRSPCWTRKKGNKGKSRKRRGEREREEKKKEDIKRDEAQEGESKRAGEVEAKKGDRVLTDGWEWVWLENPWTHKWERLIVPREEAERCQNSQPPQKLSYWAERESQEWHWKIR